MKTSKEDRCHMKECAGNSELIKLVTAFRYAIDKAKEAGEQSRYFIDFPAGRCGSTSDMLCQFLIDNGIEDISYVCGDYYGNSWEERQSHAWLEIGNTIVDITADQFKYREDKLKNCNPIYVGPMNDYYRAFEVLDRNKHLHYGIQRSWKNYGELLRDYGIIKRYI